VQHRERTRPTSHVASPEKKYIVESLSGGVDFIDCDNSGTLSTLVVNGSTVDRYRQGGDPMITLYRQSALHDRCSVADYDKDGFGIFSSLGTFTWISPTMLHSAPANFAASLCSAVPGA
jgi:hypothetical protein